jgi:serine protease Do
MQQPSSRSPRVSSIVLCLVAAPLFAAGCNKPRAEKTGELPPNAIPVATAPATPAAPTDRTTTTGAPAPSPDVKMGPLSFAPVAKKADASVVTIYTVGEESSPNFLAKKGRGKTAKGLGTGFVVQGDGVIVTNNHVIEGADEILVQFSDERRVPARVAGRDPRTDIAVVKVEGQKDLATLPFGDSDGLEVGDWVVAIGNPFGLSHTVSAGIVSAKGRGRDDVPLDPSGYYNFIQTDASINPGNSGGPLLNLNGEVVGMNTAIRGGGAQGIGFAIPINMVKQILPTLLRDGHFTRSALGVRIRDVRDLAPEDKTALKLPQGEKGAVIEFVEPNGPADKAKLEQGDVIVGFDNQPIDRGSRVQWLASTTGVGKSVNVRVFRQGKTFEVPVTLGELKEPKKVARPQPRPNDDDFDPFNAR